MTYYVFTPRKCFSVTCLEFIRLLKFNYYPFIGFSKNSGSPFGSHCIIKVPSASLIDKSFVL